MKTCDVRTMITDDEFLAELEQMATEIQSVPPEHPPSHGSSSCGQQEIAELMERLGFEPNDECAAHEVENGVRSGFPLCCILFFTSIWSKSVLLPTYQLDELVTGDYRRLLAKARKQGTLKNGYIPCPACLLAMIGSNVDRSES